MVYTAASGGGYYATVSVAVSGASVSALVVCAGSGTAELEGDTHVSDSRDAASVSECSG